jgi:hypothetical protein
MAAIALVGNAPSSGSTFLSDLLDCTSASASGPELNLFSNARLYDFAGYRTAPWRCGTSASVHTARNCIFRGDLPAYGLDGAGYERLVRESADFPAFARLFAARFLALRGKDESGTVFEKTPQNINAIGPFLESYVDGWFIYAVRNPVHVYASLLKRGFPPYIALITWLIDVAQYLPYRNHPRVLLVRYEELVREPFQVVSGVLAKACGMTGLSEASFMDTYHNNAYTRIYSGRVDSWSVQRTGVVVDANRKTISREILAAFAAGLDLAVRPAYGRLYGFEPVSFREALAEMGYAEVVDELLVGICPDRTALRLDPASRLMLGKKALYAMVSGLSSGWTATAMLQPTLSMG